MKTDKVWALYFLQFLFNLGKFGRKGNFVPTHSEYTAKNMPENGIFLTHIFHIRTESTNCPYMEKYRPEETCVLAYFTLWQGSRLVGWKSNQRKTKWIFSIYNSYHSKLNTLSSVFLSTFPRLAGTQPTNLLAVS